MYNFLHRVGWILLILLFACFTFWICISQLLRFVNGPIVVTLEKDYRNWVYEPMAITICTDYMNASAANELIERFKGTITGFDSSRSEDYHHFFNVVGTLNAENVHLLKEFESTDLFEHFTGEDLLTIAAEAKMIGKWDEFRYFEYIFLYRWNIQSFGIIVWTLLWQKRAFATLRWECSSTSKHQLLMCKYIF